MNRFLLIAACALAWSGPALAKKKKGEDEAPAAAAPAEVTPAVPDQNKDTNLKFARQLVGMTITSFNPTSASSGAKFVYTGLKFGGDNTWQASGYVEMMGEDRMECTESGTWTMEPAESATVATMVWKINQTDCVTREVGHETRYRVTLDGANLRVEYR